MATLSLRKMAAGGMYDHVGGGFHRYSGAWLWMWADGGPVLLRRGRFRLQGAPGAGMPRCSRHGMDRYLSGWWRWCSDAAPQPTP
jgi:hypothetical protein